MLAASPTNQQSAVCDGLGINFLELPRGSEFLTVSSSPDQRQILITRCCLALQRQGPVIHIHGTCCAPWSRPQLCRDHRAKLRDGFRHSRSEILRKDTYHGAYLPPFRTESSNAPHYTSNRSLDGGPRLLPPFLSPSRQNPARQR